MIFGYRPFPAIPALLVALLLATPLSYGLGQETKVPDKAGLAEKADAYLAAQARVNQFSGSVLVANGDEVLLAKGIGLANVEHRIPNSPQTKFRLGSITKQFTATAILLLAEQGKLAVDDLASKHVANCPESWNAVTIHHLLTHTSGIPSFTSLPGYRDSMPLPSPPDKTLDRVRSMPLEFTPGEKFAYSNSGYVLLGQIIESVSGQTYADFLRQNVFEPLGMMNSGYDQPEKILPHRASGYRLGATPTNASYLDMTIPHAAGALYSTVEDLHRWSRALDAGKLLSTDAFAKMFTPVKGNYGYGWFIDEQFGRKRVHHGGGINGFVTQIVRFPTEQVCIVVLSNIESGIAGGVARDLTAMTFGEKYELPQERRFETVDSKILDTYVGEYEVAPGVVLTITRDAGRLFGQPSGQPKVELRPLSDEKFFIGEINGEITFVKGDGGQLTHLLLKQGERALEARRAR
jgi:CubicO group peptidase (beta-lactamase class C family)